MEQSLPFEFYYLIFTRYFISHIQSYIFLNNVLSDYNKTHKKETPPYPYNYYFKFQKLDMMCVYKIFKINSTFN